MTDRAESFPVRLIRGDAKGIGPTLLRLGLVPLSWMWGASAEARCLLYRSGILTRHRVPCPVISVGNLTVGGTGKTPLVEWVVREIRLRGVEPVVLARGYGAAPDEIPDEAAALAENLPRLRFVRDADRVRGALTAIEKHLPGAIVLDDGFQHHRLWRALDLVTVDATQPIGPGHCLPRGMLREPIRALRRAHGIVITRSDQVAPAALARLTRRLRRAAPRAALAAAVHRPIGLKPLSGGPMQPPESLFGRAVFAVSGIGNPGAFEATLAALGGRIVGRRRFPDHHRYTAKDRAETLAAARAAGADLVATTQKDAVKWPPDDADPPVFALHVRLEPTAGAEELRALIRGALPGPSGAG